VRDTPIVAAEDFDPAQILDTVEIAKPLKGRRYSKDHQTGKKIMYLDIVTSFDIETSKRKTGPNPSDYESWLYVWQWQFGDKVTVMGRTWAEFVAVLFQINEICEARKARLLCWVHNLSFEFQFLAGIWPFGEDDVFATDKRQVLYCKLNHVEMRCSYRLSGYALDTWGKTLSVDHAKLVGNLDYSITRYPWTELTPDEIAYCVHDVMCVVECVTVTMQSYGDTLYSIPYTATGYVRRRVKMAMRYWAPGAMQEMQNELYVYDRLRLAFRGGDTHANRYCVDSLLADVDSYDRSSSYPDVMCHCKYPMTKFREEDPTMKQLKHCVEHGRACLMKIGFKNIRLRDPLTGNPYLSLDRCQQFGYNKPVWNRDPQNRPILDDNGRIIEAAYCEIALTDLDFEIISRQYVWDAQIVHWLMSARYGYLPQPLIDVIISLYKDKTALKGVTGRELEYLHAKQEINACYGMMCQRIISTPIKFVDGEWKISEVNRLEEYNESIQKAFLNYAWAVWVTAWARYRLHQGIAIATAADPLDFVYADTDSVKCRCTHNPDFSEFNAARIADATRSGAWADDPKGNRHYMGVFEFEGRYDFFKTLGAKRYCSVNDDRLTITVAGVPKESGSDVLSKNGGIEQFSDSYIFKDTGKTTAVYNDTADYDIQVDGHKLHISRYVCIVDVDYSMDLRTDYSTLVAACKILLDELQNPDYNSKC
jgi:hypothetical protein